MFDEVIYMFLLRIEGDLKKYKLVVDKVIIGFIYLLSLEYCVISYS